MNIQVLSSKWFCFIYFSHVSPYHFIEFLYKTRYYCKNIIQKINQVWCTNSAAKTVTHPISRNLVEIKGIVSVNKNPALQVQNQQ